MDATRTPSDWEGFWRNAPHGAKEVFWDAPADRVADRHLPVLETHFAARLPMIDLGCGNGTQTISLADRFRPVLGIDISAAAIDRARRQVDGRGERPPVEFRTGDAADTALAARLQEELGDCNVYIRGLLHQLPPALRPGVADAVATLVGRRGRAFIAEPAEAARGMLAGLLRRSEGPPPGLAAVLAYGVTPLEMPDEVLPGLFRAAGLTVLASGTLPLATTERDPDGKVLELPSNWLVTGRPAP
ncbi:class I SAM-dependent methyltransferase [Streptomyces aidingensis]|uniref:Methyltransferase domain-containing protein n=1 Tax=Streptomyces aidingensis TaxID=910347 RepID=A0A1I1J1X0_9ACTN|nr:class I SAM-dependent methyltransferase [Streptomyces aidingensis]SFC42012.1 Methyltransferase domain-containing protein [Streptomyces aidingensis]